MKAVQIVGRRQLAFLDVPEPTLKDGPPDTIKVRLERACLCGSDSPFFDLDHGDAYPLLLGQSIHECLGTVVESTSDRFEPGDFVLALPPQKHSGLVQYMVTPAGNAVHLPREGISKDQILMTQPLGTVIWALQKLGNLLDLDTVVIGQGPMGLLFSHMLSNLGARTVIALDKFDYRLEAGRKMRATHTVNVTREDPAAAVAEITGGKMADLVVEVVGHSDVAVDLAVDLVRHLGTVLFFGVPDTETFDNFPIGPMFRKNVTFVNSVGPDVIPNFSLARDLIAQGRVDVSPMITHTFAFQDLHQAYETFVERRDGAIKVLIDYETI